MSVQTQIDRISEGVSNALTALTDKGVTVPDGANVDSLAELIAAVEAGGGETISWVEGSFTPSETANTYTVTHGLGTVPKYILVRSSSNTIKSFATSTTTGYQTLMLGIYTPYFAARVYPSWNSTTQCYCYRNIFYPSEVGYSSQLIDDVNEETVTLRNGTAIYRGYPAFVSGAEYEWRLGY